MVPNQIMHPQDALNYMLGARASFTVTSNKTGQHYTFKLTRVKTGGVPSAPARWFVNWYCGATDDFFYIGLVDEGNPNPRFRTTAKTSAREVAKIFAWVWHQVVEVNPTRIPDSITFQHEGRCGRCNRTLTNPESISTGLGPECATKGY